jgi:hypothetical protein
VDTATAAVLTTGAIGLAGIVATFFAPTWSQRKLEQRRERRVFRTAQRLVLDEMAILEGQAETYVVGLESGSRHGAKWTANTGVFVAREWPAHREVLSASLPDDVWWVVAQAYRSVALSQQVWDSSPEDLLLGEEDLDFLKGNAASLREARAHLRNAKPRAD